jgi:hypothetical protein
MQILKDVPDEVLLEQYTSAPTGSIGTLAEWYGVPYHTMHARLTRNKPLWLTAHAVKACQLHEMSLAAIYAEPDHIIDTAGNSRIDPASVSLLKLRADHAHRLAGVLDRQYSDRQTVEVEAAGPLAEYIGRITAAGSSIPIAPQRGRIIDMDDQTDLSDTDGG